MTITADDLDRIEREGEKGWTLPLIEEVRRLRSDEWVTRAAEDFCRALGQPHTETEDGESWRSDYFDKCFSRIKRYRDGNAS